MNIEPIFSWHLDLGNIVTVFFIGIPAIIGVVKFYWTLGQYPPHLHAEKKGPLRAEGILYPKSTGKNGNQ